jgi:Mrp family chromosome partitioning ATPase
VTINQNPTEQQAVAVLGLPALARALTVSGMRVVTGDTFRGAAAATAAQLKVSPIPLILADIAAPGTLPWVERVLRSCPAVLLEVDLGVGEVRIAGNTAAASRIQLPSTLDAVLVAIGLAPTGDGATLNADGSLTATAARVLIDDDDDDWDLDELPIPVSAPVLPVTRPAPVVDAPAQLPAPVMSAQSAVPTPAPGIDFWGSLPPAVVQVPSPAPFAPVARPTAVAFEQVGVETSYSPALGRNLAPVIFTIAGKGGVGKTSLALALAQRAAVTGDLRVVLIDANRGQGDLRTYLSLNRSGLPTILDAAVTGDPTEAIVTPDRLAANRPAGTEQLSFALVQAPPPGQGDPEVITAALYHEVITAARGVAELVVIDTQIVEGAERGLFDELIIPMLHSHAFGLGIADLSKPGVDNLVTHLREFISQGVPVSRLMTMLNRVPPTTQFDLQKTSEALSSYGQFLASIPADPDIHSAMAYGASIHDNPVLAPVLDQILIRVTGNPVFTHVPPAPAAARKRRLFRRARG